MRLLTKERSDLSLIGSRKDEAVYSCSLLICLFPNTDREREGTEWGGGGERSHLEFNRNCPGI